MRNWDFGDDAGDPVWEIPDEPAGIHFSQPLPGSSTLAITDNFT